MAFSQVKKELKKLDKSELIQLISELYQKHKPVQEFLAFNLKRGLGYNLKEGKQAISDFRKLNPSSELVADLMLFYVENGVEFTNDFGDINEAFIRA